MQRVHVQINTIVSRRFRRLNLVHTEDPGYQNSIYNCKINKKGDLSIFSDSFANEDRSTCSRLAGVGRVGRVQSCEEAIVCFIYTGLTNISPNKFSPEYNKSQSLHNLGKHELLEQFMDVTDQWSISWSIEFFTALLINWSWWRILSCVHNFKLAAWLGGLTLCLSSCWQKL